MFKFLKEKLKSAVSVFSKKVEEEVEEKPKKAAKEKKPAQKEKKLKEKKKEKAEKKEEKKEAREEKGFFGKLKEKFVKEEKEEKPEKVEETEETKEENAEEEAKKRGIFGKISEAFTTKTLSDSKFNELFYDLEMILLENNVALSVVEKIKKDMEQQLVNKKLKRFGIDDEVRNALKVSVDDILSHAEANFLDLLKKKIKEKKPVVACFFGNNGNGKTTTIAKLANFLKKHKISCVLAAADTFRAAAIDQLQKHGDNLGVRVIKQTYGADAAAVAFDAISNAKAHYIDVVLIDTAGRSHSNTNLMDELVKIIRVAKPDFKIFIGDSVTGNDMVEQAEHYDSSVGIDAIVLAKADVDEKGGATISVSYVTKKPIYFLGVGQNYDDLSTFKKESILKNLGF